MNSAKKFNYIHKDSANGRWNKLTFVERMANIGSEVSPTINWKNKDKETA